MLTSEIPIYFHEDDYRIIAIYPDNGSFLPNDNPIAVSELLEVLKPFVTCCFTSVLSGYATHQERKTNVIGLGFGSNVLYVEEDKGFVKDMFLTDYAILSEKQKGYDSQTRKTEILMNALHFIGTKYRLMMIDHFRDDINVDLASRADLIIYFSIAHGLKLN